MRFNLIPGPDAKSLPLCQAWSTAVQSGNLNNISISIIIIILSFPCHCRDNYPQQNQHYLHDNHKGRTSISNTCFCGQILIKSRVMGCHLTISVKTFISSDRNPWNPILAASFIISLSLSRSRPRPEKYCSAERIYDKEEAFLCLHCTAHTLESAKD